MADINRVDRNADERAAEQSKEQSKPKAKKSDFDKAIDRQVATQKNPIFQKAHQENVTRESYREHAREMEQRQDKKAEKKKEEKANEGDRGERKTDAKIAEQKVVGKGTYKDNQGDRDGQSQGFGGGRRSRKGLEGKLMKAGARGLPLDLKSKFAQKLKDAFGKDTPKLSQEVINKIIQFVKVRINKEGEKEIELELSDKIFKGLKLKVATKGKGKVVVHLKTKNSKTRSIFEKEKSSIREALSKRGIQVDDIVIT